MTQDELLYFDKMPDMFAVYETLKEKLEQKFPDNFSVKVSKTQISFRNRYIFAMASLPYRRRKDWPEKYLLVSFGLSYKKESDRIVESIEAYPNRWTHHVIVVKEAEVDEELLGWIAEAHQFAMTK